MHWIIIFSDRGPSGHWWDFFTGKGWKHVFAVKPMADGDMLVEWAADGIHVEFMPLGGLDRLIAERGGRWEHLHIYTDWRERHDFPIARNYCVPFVARLLGLKLPWWLWTPQQFYGWLQQEPVGIRNLTEESYAR